jgi:hypothetical protein
VIHESAVECVKGSQPPAYSLLCAFGSLGVRGEWRPVNPEDHLQLLIFLLEEVIFFREKVCAALLNHQSIIRFTFSIAYLRCVCHWKRGYRRHFENGSYCSLKLFLLYLYRPAPILWALRAVWPRDLSCPSSFALACVEEIGSSPLAFLWGNYSYGLLKTHPYFLDPENFELTYLTFNLTFDFLSSLLVNLTL